MIKYKGKIKCPNCGYEKEEDIPYNECLFFYKCTNCGKLLRPIEGDCCVFCSYSDTKCIPIQMKLKFK